MELIEMVCCDENTECGIRGHHIYKNIWAVVIKELLVHTEEEINAVDRYIYALTVNERINYHWIYQKNFLMYVQFSYTGEISNAESFIFSIVTGSRYCLSQKSFLGN